MSKVTHLIAKTALTPRKRLARVLLVVSVESHLRSAYADKEV